MIKSFDPEEILGGRSFVDHDLIRRIGSGSYGEVWLGRNVTGQYRAIKFVLRANFVEDRPYDREFEGIRHYEPISRMHGGLVQVLQLGRNDELGFFYYIMELADDLSTSSFEPEDYYPHTLASELKRLQRLNCSRVLEIGAVLSDALDFLHNNQLLHRDIKPANIIFVRGQAKLADIGLVTGLATANSFVGTEGYIPAEGPTSPQADIYSLGKVLYELSTGKDRLQFPEPIEEMWRLPEAACLRELNAVILRACAQVPADRYGTAGELRDDLRLLQRGVSVQRRSRLRRFRKRLIQVGAVAAIAGGAAWGIHAYFDRTLRELQVTAPPGTGRVEGRIPVRDEETPVRCLDLGNYYNARLDERWLRPVPVKELSAFKPGLITLSNEVFDVRGVIQLSSGRIHFEGSNDFIPARVSGIRVMAPVKRLKFLHGSFGELFSGDVCMRYLVHYIDGITVEVPVRYGLGIRSSVTAEPTRKNRELTNSVSFNLTPRFQVHAFKWENPRPQHMVSDITIEAVDGETFPFVLAINMDRLEVHSHHHENLQPAVQRNRDKLVELPTTRPKDGSHFQEVELHPSQVKVESGYISGFRFTTPTNLQHHFVWSMVYHHQDTERFSWFLIKREGHTRYSFEDWYAGFPGEFQNTPKYRGAHQILQMMHGKMLQPGTEYLIGMLFRDPQPLRLHVTARFVPMDEVDPDSCWTLAAGLDLHPSKFGEFPQFARRFCLGVNQEPAEKKRRRSSDAPPSVEEH